MTTDATEGSEPGASRAERAGTDLEDGVAHLQTAARELVAAARSFLDLVEDVVNDEGRLTSVVETVTDALRGAARSVGDLGARAQGAEEPRVEHIDLD